MSHQVSWNITVKADEAIAHQLETLPEATVEQLKHNFAMTVQEHLTLTNMDKLEISFTLSDNDDRAEAEKAEQYSVSEHLVRLITSDFEGSLYPYALALGNRVKTFIEALQKTDTLNTQLHTLDTEMHQMMTEVARTYARTGKWQAPE